MMPLRPLVLVGLPKMSTAAYIELWRRTMRKLIGRFAPAPIVNERVVARTYRVRFARGSETTVPLSCCRHGRTVTVTRSVSLVVLLRVSDPTVPSLARFSRLAGVTDRPPDCA